MPSQHNHWQPGDSQKLEHCHRPPNHAPPPPPSPFPFFYIVLFFCFYFFIYFFFFSLFSPLDSHPLFHYITFFFSLTNRQWTAGTKYGVIIQNTYCDQATGHPTNRKNQQDAITTNNTRNFTFPLFGKIEDIHHTYIKFR